MYARFSHARDGECAGHRVDHQDCVNADDARRARVNVNVALARCADKWSEREIRARSRSTQSAQPRDKKNETQAIAEKSEQHRLE